MGDLLDHQEAPNTWSWTGRFAQFLPLQVTRSIHCAFNPAKNLQGVCGFWLRSANLCSLTLTLDPGTAACVMSVYLKGQLHWQCNLNAAVAQCCLLTPEDTQQGWVLAAAVADEAPSKCCFTFEGEAKSCAAVLQHVREQQAAHSRQEQQPQQRADEQQLALDQTPIEGADKESEVTEAAVRDTAHTSGSQLPPFGPAHDSPGPAATAASVQPGAEAVLQPQQLLSNVVQLDDAALNLELQRCMKLPAFWSLVNRMEALWEELGMPNVCAVRDLAGR